MDSLQPKIYFLNFCSVGLKYKKMAVAPQWIISDEQLLVPKSLIGSGFHPNRTHSDTKFCLFSLLLKFGWHYHLIYNDQIIALKHFFTQF